MTKKRSQVYLQKPIRNQYRLVVRKIFIEQIILTKKFISCIQTKRKQCRFKAVAICSLPGERGEHLSAAA